MKTEQKPLIKQGWLRAVLYLIVMIAIMGTIQFGAGFLLPAVGVDTKGTNGNEIFYFIITYLLVTVAVFGFTFLCRRLVDRKSFASLGFQFKGYQNEALLGFFTGPALLGIGTIILILLGYLSFIDVAFSPFIFLELVLMVIIAFTEELLVRGYVLNNLLQSMNKWVALFLSSLLFALFHILNPDVSVLALVNIFVAGLLLGINYIYTKNLWFGIFFHFSWNFFQGPVFGYEVSGFNLQGLLQQTLNGPEIFTGGRFGFEGSLLCAALTAIATAYFAFVFSRMYQQVSPAGNLTS